jgi:Rad52/22 family double-strand break repair protein
MRSKSTPSSRSTVSRLLAKESNAASPGQAHEYATKAAETDATKRALSTFGNLFGLSLYAGSSDLTARTAANGLAAAPGGPQAPISRVIDPMSALRRREPPAAATNGRPTSSIEVPEAWPHTLTRRPIDKSLLALPEPKRMRSKDHLRYATTQPCCVWPSLHCAASTMVAVLLN